MRGFSLLVVTLSLLFISCANNNSVYRGSSVDGEKSYKTIQRPSSPNIQKFKRVALVIGNNNYEEAPLTNAIDDARAMKTFLKSKNFEVVYAENTTEQVMRDKVDTFLDSLDEESIGFVYYSGHGIQEYSNREKRVTNYLIPIDNRKFKRKTDLDYSAISLNYILDTLSAKRNGLNIVLLDACRSPFKAFSRSTQSGLAPSNAKGVYIAYATADGEKALDNGLFRRSFIKYAQQPLKLIEIFERVKVDVYNQSKQFPFISNGKRGIFYFTPIEEDKTCLIFQLNDGRKIKGCTKGCNKNIGINCAGMGLIYEKGTNKIEKNEYKALTFYKKACDLGSGLGCYFLGNIYNYGRAGLKKDKSKALNLFYKSCELNEGMGCRQLGVFYHNGDGNIVKNEFKAKNFFTKACKLNNSSSCAYLGDKSDEKTSKILFYKKACKFGNTYACRKLGSLYEKEKRYYQAKDFFTKGCNLKDGESCARLGCMYKDNIFGENRLSSMALYLKSCNLKNGHGCYHLALIQKDVSNQLKFLKKSCELKTSKSCHLLGMTYRFNKKIKNISNSIKFYKKACDLNLSSSCNSLGLMYSLGKEVPKDYAKAKYFYEKTCDLDINIGFLNLSELLLFTNMGIDKEREEKFLDYIKNNNLQERMIEYDMIKIFYKIRDNQKYLQDLERWKVKYEKIDNFCWSFEEMKVWIKSSNMNNKTKRAFESAIKVFEAKIGKKCN